MDTDTKKQVRVYGHGVHDFCQEGHDRNFMQAKYAFPNAHLTIGLLSDAEIKANSGLKLLFTELERQESVFHCRHVDQILVDVPWVLNQQFIDKHNFDYIAITDQKTQDLLLLKHNRLPDEATNEPAQSFIDKLKQDGRFLELKAASLTGLEPKDGTYEAAGRIAAFNDDQTASEKRNKCPYDFSNRLTLESAKKISSLNRPIRIYADGIYDMFHPGHARQLRQAKDAFPYVHLIVGVVNDDLTHRLKGPTVVPEAWRYDRVRHCRYVDEVLKDAPWVLCEEFLVSNKIDFVAHDDLPYKCEGQEDIYKFIKELGMFLTTQRMVGLSTTDLKIRIKQHSQ